MDELRINQKKSPAFLFRKKFSIYFREMLIIFILKIIGQWIKKRENNVRLDFIKANTENRFCNRALFL